MQDHTRMNSSQRSIESNMSCFSLSSYDGDSISSCREFGGSRGSLSSVHFPSDDDELETIHQLEQDDTSTQELWFTKDEYKKIRRRNRLFIQLHKTNSFKESDTDTFLGLERQTLQRRVQSFKDRRRKLLRNSSV